MEEEEKKESGPYKIGERYLTEDELEEKRRFEEQKQALVDRAERLRQMGLKLKKDKESADEIENIPAYLRKYENFKKEHRDNNMFSFTENESLQIIIDQGNADDDIVSELLAELSYLYRMTGGSGINFEFDGILKTQSTLI
ncbi:MAG: hypothetical protein V4649_08490 [Bacteroidota bacterium]